MNEEAIVKVQKKERFKVTCLDMNSNEQIVFNLSKYFEGTLEINKCYVVKFVRKENIIWLNEAEPTSPPEEKGPKEVAPSAQPGTFGSKFDELITSKNAVDVKQLLIMAQSAQHDAAQLVASGIDMKNFNDAKEVAEYVADLRDLLLEDLVNKYYK